MSCKGDCVVLYTSKGEPFAVSPEDVEWVTQRSWAINSRGYLLANIGARSIYLHHAVMARCAPSPPGTGPREGFKSVTELAALPPTPQGWVRDHEDRDPLHNCRGNLRWVLRHENSLNANRVLRARTGFWGVYPKLKNGRRLYVVSLRRLGRTIHVGYFTDPSEGARAYNRAALEIDGRYARLNEVREPACSGGRE
jgi:hypothetical protein